MKVINTLAKKPIIGSAVRKLATFLGKRRADAIPRHFSQFFIPRFANTLAYREEAYRVRHKVYCEELGFEEIRENGLETDEFDANSLHLLIQNIATKDYAGTVRLVCSSNSSELLPIEKFCEHSLHPDSTHPGQFPREKICEISRLAVSADFRKRASDKFAGAAEGGINTSTYSEKEIRCFPFIAVGLYLGVAALSKQKGIEHFFVMMEPKLARSMAFIGIKFEKIGDTIEYHGKRAPYYINHKILTDSMSPSLGIMLQNLSKELSQQVAEDSKSSGATKILSAAPSFLFQGSLVSNQ